MDTNPDEPVAAGRHADAGDAERAVEISAEGVCLAFGDHVVLEEVDVTVRRGDVVAIVGDSGCGKTVLLEILIGQLAPDGGRVRIADHDDPAAPLRDLAELSHEDMDGIRRHWAIVFQRNALFSGTVFENIALWLREIRGLDDATIRPLALRALVAVGFEDEAEEVLERDRDELSGGMAKRIAIARAIAMEPIILFYDEPTTGLDPHHAGQIHDLIIATHERAPSERIRRTTVIVTHDKDLLHRLRPRMIMLHEGRVDFDGPFDAFASSDSPIVRPYFDLMPALQQRPGDH